MTTPKTTDLTLELDLGLYGRLCQLAVQQKKLPVEIAEEAVRLHVDALDPRNATTTVELDLPTSTIEIWRARARKSGRSVEQEISISVLIEAVRLGIGSLRESGR